MPQLSVSTSLSATVLELDSLMPVVTNADTPYACRASMITVVDSLTALFSRALGPELRLGFAPLGLTITCVPRALGVEIFSDLDWFV